MKTGTQRAGGKKQVAAENKNTSSQTIKKKTVKKAKKRQKNKPTKEQNKPEVKTSEEVKSEVKIVPDTINTIKKLSKPIKRPQHKAEFFASQYDSPAEFFVKIYDFNGSSVEKNTIGRGKEKKEMKKQADETALIERQSEYLGQAHIAKQNILLGHLAGNNFLAQEMIKLQNGVIKSLPASTDRVVNILKHFRLEMGLATDALAVKTGDLNKAEDPLRAKLLALKNQKDLGKDM